MSVALCGITRNLERIGHVCKIPVDHVTGPGDSRSTLFKNLPMTRMGEQGPNFKNQGPHVATIKFQLLRLRTQSEDGVMRGDMNLNIQLNPLTEVATAGD